VKITLLLVAICLASSSFAQEPKPAPKDPAFYHSGNDFLSHCDDSSVYMLSLNRSGKELWAVVCNYWAAGVMQGMAIEDNIRPEQTVSGGNAKTQQMLRDNEEAFKNAMAAQGIKALSYPDGDVCVPDDVTNDQIKMVIIAYMKAHPGELTRGAASLAIAAFKTGWVCKAGAQ
jgi:hypothetical protein